MGKTKIVILIAGILSLGIVVFNNIIQLSQTLLSNTDYIIGLMIALIVTIIYGIINKDNL